MLLAEAGRAGAEAELARILVEFRRGLETVFAGLTVGRRRTRGQAATITPGQARSGRGPAI